MYLRSLSHVNLSKRANLSTKLYEKEYQWTCSFCLYKELRKWNYFVEPFTQVGNDDSNSLYEDQNVSFEYPQN